MVWDIGSTLRRPRNHNLNTFILATGVLGGLIQGSQLVQIWQYSCDLSADQVTLGSTGFFTTLFLLAQSTKPTPETHAQLLLKISPVSKTPKMQSGGATNKQVGDDMVTDANKNTS